MEDLRIEIKQSKSEITKISFECDPKVGYDIIQNISKDYNITVVVDSKGGEVPIPAMIMELSKTHNTK